MSDFETAAREAGMDEAGRELFRSSLAKVIDFVDGLPGERTAWVLPSRHGQIDAVLTLRGRPAGPESHAELLALLAAPDRPDQRVDVINRTIREVELRSGLAVESHDFSVGHDFEEGTRPASERAAVTIFPPSGDWAADLLLVTQDLLLFEDSLEYLHSIAESIVPFSEMTQ